MGRRGLTRGAVVVIVSDGWERGDLGLLDAELGAAARQAHRLVWVNPLKGHEGFAPLAGGMRIALRHSDVFVEGHNLVALEALAEVLSSLAEARWPAGRQPPHGLPGERRRDGALEPLDRVAPEREHRGHGLDAQNRKRRGEMPGGG